jgi:dTDP-4-amino-4,6-dideoxygalactose transaminase
MFVPMFDLAAELRPIRAELDAAISRVLDSGVVVGGDEVSGFEAELRAVTGARHAVGVSSGSDALLALLMALGVGREHEVVTTPLTFIATAEAAARLGARVVFADIDDATLTLDPAAALSACSERTRAMILVHLFGRLAAGPANAPCDVLEDAAQSIGAVPQHPGRAAAISFFPTKNLGAIGDAGAVVTDDAELAERIVALRAHGSRAKYHAAFVGGNFRLDALQAAILRAKLPHLPAWTAARRAHAEHYRALFASARVPAELRLPAPSPEHVYHQFVIRAPRRDELRAHLLAAGIGSEIYYPVPLHLQACFADLGYRADSLPNAERACREVLALPIQPALSAESQAIVVDEIARFYKMV